MDKIIYLILMLFFLHGCSKEKLPSENDFEKEYSILKGKWVYIYKGGRCIIEFKEDNIFKEEYEIQTISADYSGTYHIHSKDSLKISMNGYNKLYYFEIDSNKNLKIEYLFYNPKLNLFVKADTTCDQICSQSKKNQLLGNWKTTGIYYCDTCTYILSFRENDTIYKIKNSKDTVFKYRFDLYPDNYFGKHREADDYHYYNNYWLKSDTLLIEELISTFQGSYIDTVYYIKQ